MTTSSKQSAVEDELCVTDELLTLPVILENARNKNLHKWHIRTTFPSTGSLSNVDIEKEISAAFKNDKNLSGIQPFSNLKDLVLDGWGSAAQAQVDIKEDTSEHKDRSLTWLHMCKSLKSLTLTRCCSASVLESSDATPSSRTDSSFLSRLEEICISHDTSLDNLSWLSYCSNLTALSLRHMRESIFTSDLTNMMVHTPSATLDRRPFLFQQLAVLDLSNTGISSVQWMRVAAKENHSGNSENGYIPMYNLQVLRLTGCDRLFDLFPIFSSSDMDEREKMAESTQVEEHNTNHTTLLPQLRVLDISWSGVNDLRFVHLCSKTLKELYMNGCKVIGDHHRIGQLTHLEILHAQSTTFSDIEWITGCQALREVDLGRCRLLEDISPLSHLPNLRSLYCPCVPGSAEKWSWLAAQETEENNITSLSNGRRESPSILPHNALLKDPSSCCSWTSCLTVLHIDECSSLGDGQALASLTAVKTLVLSDVNITSLDFVSNYSNLEVMALTSCRSISNEKFGPISRLGKLQQLQLSDLVLKDVRRFFHSGAACIKSLQKLELSLCSSLNDITGVSLLQHLKSLLISEASLGDICAELQHCLALEEVDVSYVDTLDDFSFVQHLPKLRSVSISRTSLSQIDFFHGGTENNLWSSVEDLHISYCYMISALPSFASLASSLRSLHLSNVGVELLEGLEFCHKLSELYIGCCTDLTDIRVTNTSGSFPNLKNITIHDCANLRSLDWLSAFCKTPVLRELKISSCKKVEKNKWEEGLKSAVRRNPSLVHLEITDSIPSLATLATFFPTSMDAHENYQLTELRLSGLPALVSLEGIENVPFLLSLRLSNCASITDILPVGKCNQLLQLDVSRCPKLADLSGVWDAPYFRSESSTANEMPYPRLQILKIADIPLVESFGTSITRCKDLYALHISACPRLKELMATSIDANRDIRLHSNLKQLKLMNAGITDVKWLVACPNLQEIEISFCPSLVTLEGIHHLLRLRKLIITMCGLETLEPLRGAKFLSYLEEADFSFCEALEDMSALSGIADRGNVRPQALKRVSGYGTAVADVSWLESCPALEKIDFRECKKIKAFGDLSAEKLLRLIH